MKQYLYIIGALLAIALAGCDYDDRNFKDAKDMSKPANVIKAEYTVIAADIPVMVAGMAGSGDPVQVAYSEALNKDKYFSEAAPAAVAVPYLLKSKYYSGDEGSSVYVTYQNQLDRPEELTALSGATYVLSDDNYKSAWGDVFVSSFTPAKPAGASMPAILASEISEPENGQIQYVEYFYSEEEAYNADVEDAKYTEDFDQDYAANDPVNKHGWTLYQETGTSTWQIRSFSGNFYAQLGNVKEGAHIAWMVTPQLDYSAIANPDFSFDVKVGYWNADCLTVLLTTDETLPSDDITAATWVDITSKFTIPQVPTNAYGDFASAGKLDLSQYAGGKVYIAFKYSGTDAEPKRTTTYQIDNVKVTDLIPGLEVDNKKKEYGIYEYNGTAWAKYSDNNTLQLQPEDYVAMGISSLSVADAPKYLPVWLRAKYPYAQEGTAKTVIHRTNSAGANYASMLVFTDGNWVVEDFMQTQTDQFLLTKDGWMFDPTIMVTLTKPDYQLVVDHAIINIRPIDPDAVTYDDSEYYWGFSARYGNISYRESDRSKDDTYPKTGTLDEKVAFMNQRTIEGLEIFLNIKYPDARPEVSGVAQFAFVKVLIYSDPSADKANLTWEYKLQCTDVGKWKFIQRVSEDGAVEVAKE